MPSPPIDRSPLDHHRLRSAVGPAWRVVLLPSAGSTNQEALAEPPGTIVVAEHQTTGRGRLDRVWNTPPGTALTFSMVLAPDLPEAEWGLLPLAVAVGVADAVADLTGIDVRLKWPNDVQIDERKLAGILLERVGGEQSAVVVGVGVNVAMTVAELPVPSATSLRMAGAEVDRSVLLGALVVAIECRIGQTATDPAAMLTDYRRRSVTIGRSVRVHLPGDRLLQGTAEAIDATGCLIVDGTAVAAGDVVHVRGNSGAQPPPDMS